MMELGVGGGVLQLFFNSYGITVKSSFVKRTCIGLEVLWGDHDDKTYSPFIPKHFISPATNGAHALHSSNAIVGNEDLEQQNMIFSGFRLTRVG